MNKVIIISIILFLIIIIFNTFIYLLRKKINKLEGIILELFKKRNNQIITIYGITKNTLVRHDDIFESFLKLKRQDFSENSYNAKLDDKMYLYKKIHYEINFIIKVCEKHKKISINPCYIYIKDSILNKSSSLGKNLDLYNNISKKYNILSKFSIVGLFI